MGEKNNGILEKISPNSPFIIHHSSFPLSPLLLNSFVLHFFKRLNSYGNSRLGISIRRKRSIVSTTRSNRHSRCSRLTGVRAWWNSNGSFPCFGHEGPFRSRPEDPGEDLIVMKAFASRTQDWADIEGIIVRSGQKLDFAAVEERPSPFSFHSFHV